MIEAAEDLLRDAGFYDVRVRHHTVGNSANEAQNSKLWLARIEVGANDVARFLDAEIRGSVTSALKQIGYAYVTLDLQGYRRGSANEVFAQPKEG